MAQPNTFRQSVRDEAEKAINRRIAKSKVTDGELDLARAEWDLSDYNAFVSDCRKTDRDMSRCGAIWNILKDSGFAPTDDGDEAEEQTSSGGDRRLPSTPGPETVDELEEEFRAADHVYLVVTTGCPSCAQAKETLSDWIDQGVVQVEDVQQSDKAADIVMETNLDALPALVIEHDGQLAAV